VEIHRSARRHQVKDADIHHATDHPLVVVDLDRDGDPLLAIHAMPLRPALHDLLPSGEDVDG
jgi:hypothetical protein